jgi:CoA-transferase family III
MPECSSDRVFKPLAGIWVADFSWVIAGPWLTKILAYFGAEVIRIESRSRPDAIRLCQAIGSPAWADQPEFATLLNRRIKPPPQPRATRSPSESLDPTTRGRRGDALSTSPRRPRECRTTHRRSHGARSPHAGSTLFHIGQPYDLRRSSDQRSANAPKRYTWCLCFSRPVHRRTQCLCLRRPPRHDRHRNRHLHHPRNF